MKLTLALALVGVCALTSAVPARIVDKDLLMKQRKILGLLYHINQPTHIDEHVQSTYDVEKDRDSYTKPEVVDKVVEFWYNGYQLPRGEIFSIAYPNHLEQAMALFDLFYYAKDFDTFYKVAIEARKYVNEGLFLYSLSVAVVHRRDCYGIMLPPIYEIYPNYFFDSETIMEAYRMKQTMSGVESGKTHGLTITSNYSGHYLNLHPEQAMSYYMEDIGINAFYYNYYLYYPFWMDGEKYGLDKDWRGGLYIFIYRQLLSRFYLERLSNGMGQIPILDFETPMETPYYPSLMYPNGLPFPERPKFAKLSDYFYTYGEKINTRYGYSYSYIKDYTHRIADLIDRGYVFDKTGKKIDLYTGEGLNILGNLMQANPDSPNNRYYGDFIGYARHLLGYSYTPLTMNKVAPSALEHKETSLRDPAFYQLYKYVFRYIQRYQSYLKPYTKEELMFPGVMIEKVEMDRLITYFEEFYTDLSQAMYYSEDELKQHRDLKVRAKQYRLDHKPFTYKIYVKSDKDTKTMVKVFLGPKYDEHGRYINMSENRWNFFELDKFTYDLKSGDNIIKRSSLESMMFSEDKPGFLELYKKVKAAMNDEGEYTVDLKQNYINFPRRYMLPKGTIGGFPYQFYFIIYPFDKPYKGNMPDEWKYGYPMPGMGGPYMDMYPLSYPFDRPIKYGKMFYNDIPNTFFYETRIYHKTDINTVTGLIIGSLNDTLLEFGIKRRPVRCRKPDSKSRSTAGMKLALVFALVGLCALAVAVPTTTTTTTHSFKSKIVDKAFLEKQQKVLTLFYHIQQPSYYEEHLQIVQAVPTFHQWLHDNKALFTKPEVVEHAIEFFHHNYWLHKGEIFSVAQHEHKEQAVALFKLFYYAKDFDTFYKTAVYARHHLNEGLFLYSVSVAVVHRQDTYGIILPPIYEIYPWYFFNSDVIHQAYKQKQIYEGEEHKSEHKHHHIFANYSGHYLNLHPEQSLSYYLEDIGINAQYYYFQIFYPFWMDGEEFGIKHDYRGELFFFVYQNLIARYYLERLSHRQGQIPILDWEVPITVPYYSSLQYPNGLPFPERPAFANLHTAYFTYGQHINSPYGFSYNFVHDYERRISDAIDRGYVYTNDGQKVDLYSEHGLDVLANLINSNPDSPNSRYYGGFLNFARHLLGYSYTPVSYHKLAPSVLEHPETSLRDPAFYMLYKKVFNYLYKYQAYLHPYNKTDLVFPGVEIEKVEVDRLITYFDDHISDLSNAVWDSVNELKEDNFHIYAVQQRLNHKPFTYKIYVKSDKSIDATVKVFLGPKYDEYGRYINITENRWNFVVIDAFKWQLQAGENVIKRSSQESEFYGPDRTSYHDLYKKVLSAHKGQEEFHITGAENYFSFPHRYMLPKGSAGGVPFQFYFIVYPHKQYHQHKEHEFFYPRPGTGAGYVDDYPLYYPFDRPIKFGHLFVDEVPNSHFHEVKVYHKEVPESGIQHVQNQH
ncbi:uncharacterized protein LOC132700094 [Cylas formicarius]|uniref:uncharacterized protein LOC132700094 n=1 Tax=Cylas formicarius TaxID=197179 RepID=UPI0029583734|nr:uncharacterized protein LOC132700094 [Cylas formicarius]